MKKREFGDLLRDIRRERKLTAGDIAKMTGFPTSTITRWERGERLPGLDRLIILETALGVEPGFFARGINVNRQQRIEES